MNNSPFGPPTKREGTAQEQRATRVTLAVGGAQLGDGEPGVVFEGVEGLVAEEILDMVE